MTAAPKRTRKRRRARAEVWIDPWPSGSWPAEQAESLSELGQPVKKIRRAKAKGWGYIAAPRNTGKR